MSAAPRWPAADGKPDRPVGLGPAWLASVLWPELAAEPGRADWQEDRASEDPPLRGKSAGEK